MAVRKSPDQLISPRFLYLDSFTVNFILSHVHLTRHMANPSMATLYFRPAKQHCPVIQQCVDKYDNSRHLQDLLPRRDQAVPQIPFPV